MLEHLQKYFGYTSFREGQEDIVRRITAGEELCVVMPTGAGKSLCYQLPILIRPGYGLVISPLISLMKDQVDALNARGIRAVCVNSSVPPALQTQYLQEVANGEMKFLYVAPERFRTQSFKNFLTEHRPSLLVVDEAHCISQWGHDFRPDYQRIWKQFPLLEELQVCAFTATATPHVRDDIREQMGHHDMLDVVTGFRRPNLNFSVICVNSKPQKVELVKQLTAESVPTIIYAATRKDVEMLGSELNIHIYHAGMTDADRREAQNYFATAPCPTLVATNAFGMGIDRADVRKVIHFNLPGSLEAYYQEAGRAGRDGKPADCLLINSFQDIKIQEFILDMNNPEFEELQLLHKFIYDHRRPDNSCLWVPDAAAAELTTFSSTSKVAAAARILERQGIVERMFAMNGLTAGYLQFIKPLGAVEKENLPQKTQRAIFMYRLSRWLQSTQQRDFQGTPNDLMRITGFREDQLPKVLDALNGKELTWTTGPVDSVLMLTPEGLKFPLQIDKQWLIKKRDLDFKRLHDVTSYCNCNGCRQAYIIRYFGENIGSWHCGCCDHCRHGNESTPQPVQNPTAAELKFAQTILKAINVFDGRFGRKRIAGLLLGEPDDNAVLESSAFHGNLKNVPRGRIIAIINALVDAGYLCTTDGDYPCLAITAKGSQAIKFPQTILFESTKSFSRRSFS